MMALDIDEKSKDKFIAAKNFCSDNASLRSKFTPGENAVDRERILFSACMNFLAQKIVKPKNKKL